MSTLHREQASALYVGSSPRNGLTIEANRMSPQAVMRVAVMQQGGSQYGREGVAGERGAENGFRYSQPGQKEASGEAEKWREGE